jgi:hypothetical protein
MADIIIEQVADYVQINFNDLPEKDILLSSILTRGKMRTYLNQPAPKLELIAESTHLAVSI